MPLQKHDPTTCSLALKWKCTALTAVLTPGFPWKGVRGRGGVKRRSCVYVGYGGDEGRSHQRPASFSSRSLWKKNPPSLLPNPSPPVFVAAVTVLPLMNSKMLRFAFQSGNLPLCGDKALPPHTHTALNHIKHAAIFCTSPQQCNCGPPLHHYAEHFWRPVYKLNK